MILALTPNLSLDRVITLERPLTAGQLHRVLTLQVAAGGKGVNLARAVRALGGESGVAGVVAGFNGQRFRALLEEEGLPGWLLGGHGETRECYILLDPQGGSPTELYESGFAVMDAELDALLALLPADQTVLCGSLPPGCSPDMLGALLGRLNRLVVDSSEPGLRAAVKAGVPMITPNTHELAQLTGSGTVEAAQDLFRRSGVQVLLTRGEAGAVYVGEETWEARAPEIEVRNPVGSGDALLGAFLYARQQGDSVQDALRLAVGTGSANAMLGGPLNLRAEVARDLAGRVQVSRRT